MLAQKEMQEMEYNGCGCFNDMDMLVVGMNGSGNVGVGGCTFEEYKTHFSFWAFMGSPLMIGCDIRNMTDEDPHKQGSAPRRSGCGLPSAVLPQFHAL